MEWKKRIGTTLEPHDYENKDGWLLFFTDGRPLPQRWVVANANTETIGSNATLNSCQDDEAKIWANGIIAEYLERREKEKSSWPPSGS